MEDTLPPKVKRRRWRRITPEVIESFRVNKMIEGNGQRAVEVMEPDSRAPHMRANAIMKVSDQQTLDGYVDRAIETGAVLAIDRVTEIISSSDERVALSASTFMIEQRRGKAVQKSESKSVILSVQSVLE